MAALVSLNAQLTKKKLKNYYVVQIKASLAVRRADDNELLSVLSFKEQTSLSTASYSMAKKDALRKLSLNLKQRLAGPKSTVLKTLGFYNHEN